MSRWKQTIQEHVPLAFVFLCTMILFGRVLLTGEALYGGDFALYFYPLKEFIRDHLLNQGTIPLWNPYLFSGTPLIGNIQASLFYPLGFLFYLMPSDQAYGYTVMMHCLLSSVFMYSFMRASSVSKGGSLLSAFVFTFNGYFMGHLYAGHLTFIQSYIWIPLVFHLLFRFVQSKAFEYTLSAGVILGVQILGGFPQIVFYTMLGAGFSVMLYGLISEGACRFRSAFRLGAGVALTVGIGFCIAAVQVLPTWEFAQLSTRAGGVSYAMATYESLHPKELLAFLIPEIFGNPVDQTYWRSGEFWHFWESCGYAGILPLMLLFIKTEARSFRSLRICFWALLLLSLFLALGRFNFFYPLIYQLPGFKSFRIPAQILFLYIFAVAVLSGMGLDRILQKEWSWHRMFLPVALAVGLVLATLTFFVHYYPYDFFLFLFSKFADQPVSGANLAGLSQKVSLSVDRAFLLLLAGGFLLLACRYGKLKARFMSLLALGILFLDLFLFGSQFVRPYDPFVVSDEKEAVSRIMPRTPSQGRVVTSGSFFRANDGLRFGFPSVLGYDPLILKRYAEFIAASQNWPYDEHLVNLEHLRDPDAKLLKHLNLRWQVHGKTLRRMESDLPYAYLVNHAVTKPQEMILSLMGTEDHDPRRTVVLESGGGGKMQPKTAEAGLRSCTVLSFAPDTLSLKASVQAPGYLVLSEVFYPGWIATVDDKKVDVLAGNYLFRVIPVDEGEHVIRFRFISWSFRIGIGISCLTFLIALFLITRKRRSAEKDGRG